MAMLCIWPLPALFLAFAWPHIARAGESSSSPLSIPPTLNWNGDDGTWSSFAVEIGTPPQAVSLFPFTTANAIWTVLTEGCTPEDPQDCGTSRGSLFNSNRSSSWEFINYYQLYLENQLNYTGNAEFAYDNVTLGWPGTTNPILDHQIIMGIAAKDFYLGGIGLCPSSINLTTVEDSHPSLLTSIRSAGLIASTSWAYTAGAYYRTPSALGSLTLGGYDSTRFTSNNLYIPFSSSNPTTLSVPIQSITTDVRNTPLLSTGIFATIDSSVPQIWLPLEACQAFEQAFNLTYNETAEAYLVSEELHQQLLAQNANITFQIGANLADKNYIEIVLPYASFDLQANPPFVETATRYFPLRRATSQDQYTLGRTFLQEAYVIADYDRVNFSISAALFPDPSSPSQLVSIIAPGESSTSKISNAMLGGVAAVVASSVLLVSLCAYIFIRKRRRRQSIRAELSEEAAVKDSGFEKPELDSTEVNVSELSSKDVKLELPEEEGRRSVSELFVPGYKTTAELENTEYFELPGDDVKPLELDANAKVQIDVQAQVRPESDAWSFSAGSADTI